MRFEKGVSKVPTGERSILKTKRETLTALEVKNKVVWVNPDLDTPFNLKVGESTELGVFVSTQNLKNEKLRNVEVDDNHQRSILLGRTIFKDNKKSDGVHQAYRDIDIKGAGYVIDAKTIGSTSMKGKTEAFGILNEGAAYQDMAISEVFHDYGIRTHRVIAIIELEEIICYGEKMSIEDVKAMGVIGESSKPVLEIRAFGTRMRLMDAASNNTPSEKKDLIINDARVLVAQELGIDPENFSLLDYAKWLARSIGRNVGLMHSHGYMHKFLTQGHNFTLDGSIVDFDSVQLASSYELKDFKAEYIDASMALAGFLSYGMGYDRALASEIHQEYEDAYKEIEIKV